MSKQQLCCVYHTAPFLRLWEEDLTSRHMAILPLRRKTRLDSSCQVWYLESTLFLTEVEVLDVLMCFLLWFFLFFTGNDDAHSFNTDILVTAAVLLALRAQFRPYVRNSLCQCLFSTFFLHN